MNTLRLFVISIIMASCSQVQKEKGGTITQTKSEPGEKNPDIENTIWEHQIAEGCINSYIFKSGGNYLFYSCEMEDTLYGKYSFSGDTLILNEEGSVYDDVYPEDSIHRAGKKIYWISINNDHLKHLRMSEWVIDKFVPSDYQFGENYLYKKSDKKY